MAEPGLIEELTAQISAVRENLRELIEQAAGLSGAADDDRASSRIAEQELKLARLTKQLDELSSVGEASS
jgi:chromosome segregation ATPase